MSVHQIVYWPKLLFDWGRFLRHETPGAVIHTNWHHLLLLWPWLSVDRDIYWVHDILPNTPRYSRFVTALSRRIRFFAPVSGAVGQVLRDLGVPDEKIRVIHNGIQDPSAGCSSIARPKGEVSIGIVGAVGEWKGHEDLLKAFADLAGDLPEARLQIFGADDKPFALALKQRAAALGLGNRITWHGFVGDRSLIYQALDICAVPSRCEEALPTTAIEAAFFGLPVVATRKGGLSEIIINRETGILVDAGNPDQLAKCLRELVLDASLRACLGEAARRRAVTLFARERFAGDFLQFLTNNACGGSSSHEHAEEGVRQT